MTVLAPPRPTVVDRALTQAQAWCAGYTIDDRPALAHAARVAVTLGHHVSQPDPELIAAALLHDSPEFAPTELDLDQVLTQHYSPGVCRIVRSLQAEHHALDTGNPTIPLHDLPVLLASTADKIVALRSLLRRAHLSGAPEAFFTARPALHAVMPHFDDFHRATAGHVPPSMSRALGLVLGELTTILRKAA